MILAELWLHMEFGILLESFNAVTDYSVWNFATISIWVKTDFVLKIKAFKNKENNYFSHDRKSKYFTLSPNIKEKTT